MAILVSGVIGFGLADYALASAGYDRLGMFVWGGGYLATMFVLWYGWVRPLDMTGI
ncbi:putative membrane protein [Halorhabdus sp. BNX81]|nr:putative membrane protein [Halorhabdus sp. BNX81]